METYGLAQSGAVVDNNLTPHGSDLWSEITGEFIDIYGNSTSGNWSAETTLFITFFGVNDVNLVLPMKNQDSMLDKIFGSYGNGLTEVRWIKDRVDCLGSRAEDFTALHQWCTQLPFDQ